MITPLLAVLCFWGCGASDPSDASDPAETSCTPETVTEVPSVEETLLADLAGTPVVVTGSGLRLEEGQVTLDVPWLRARLEPHGTYVDLDDTSSFDVHIEAMRFRLDAQALASVLPDKAPVGSLELTTDGDAFVVKGSASFLDLPLELRAVPEATADGRLELVVDKAKVLGIGILPALELIDEQIGDNPSLFVVEGEHLYLDPFATTRQPDVQGRFTHAEVVDGALVATLGDGDGGEVPEADGSWLTVEEGVLKTGGTLVFGSTIRLLPEDVEHLTLGRGFDQQLRRGFAKQRSKTALDFHVPPPERSDGVAEAEDRARDSR